MKNRIYLDHAATTPLNADVLAEMLPYFIESGHNPSSLHAEGRRARAGLDRARDRAAAALGVARKEITFVGSGSEADNQAILSVARTYRARGSHIVSTQIEHHAILHALDALRDEGFDVTLLQVDEQGMIDPAAFAAALRDDTVLASVMYANNEIGVVQPIARLAAAARERGVIFHTDAVQGAGLIDIRPRELGVDLLSLSAHKFYGPKGVGILYVRDGLALPPLVHGGGQEFGRRSGTENVAGIVGLAAALERAVAGTSERAVRVAALRDRLEAGIRARAGEVRINGAGAPRLANNSNVSFAGIDSEALLMRFDLEGIAVSAGSACTSGALEPSHVIAALRADPRWHQGVIRFSLGEATTEEEIDRVLELVPRITADLQGRAS
ncbi:MAG TPA: cysteine desulfurase family protein [Candidatus Acidoferrum sp.]|jgi:cysteine desulfurase|nr:cysteine desulfurase family protein [Candidatus Acidoferrum sp.]